MYMECTDSTVIYIFMGQKQLNWKTAMLLALPRPSRSADLSQLSLRGKQYKPEGVTFRPRSWAKQSRETNNRLFLPFFPT